MTTVDTSELKQLEDGLRQYEHILPKSVANSAMRKALSPMRQSVRNLAPVGTVKSENGWGKRIGPEYRRGGATRRDIRFKIGKSYNKAITNGIVGVSRMPGKVGWRTQFITLGTRDRKTKKGSSRGRITANNFLQRAYDSTIEFARASYGGEVLTSFYKWAKRNLPQRRF